MLERHYDRAAQDIGNIINLGHVNVSISDQHVATNYYVTGLGLTRDPFLMTGSGNMWINVGMSQFHLPIGKPEVLRGVTGLVIPDREALLARLANARKLLAGTKFDFRESNDCVETVCPWGNRIHVHTPGRGALRPRRARHRLCALRRSPRHRRSASCASIVTCCVPMPIW